MAAVLSELSPKDKRIAELIERLDEVLEENRQLRALAHGGAASFADYMRAFGFTTNEAKTFSMLVDARGVTLRGDVELMLWPGAHIPDYSYVSVIIFKIRKKLRAYAPQIKVDLLWGQGYLLSRESKENLETFMAAWRGEGCPPARPPIKRGTAR